MSIKEQNKEEEKPLLVMVHRVPIKFEDDQAILDFDNKKFVEQEPANIFNNTQLINLTKKISTYNLQRQQLAKTFKNQLVLYKTLTKDYESSELV